MFTLTITLGNDAMQTLGDVADALARVSRYVEAHAWDIIPGESRGIFDENGNRVGEWSMSE